MSVSVRIDGAEPIMNALSRLSEINGTRLNAIKAKQVTEISNRAAGAPGSPGATPRDTGELRISAHQDTTNFEFGYAKEYAPHVEYGHRTRSGGFVPGQRYLQTNANIQLPIYKADVEKEIKKILNGG